MKKEEKIIEGLKRKVAAAKSTNNWTKVSDAILDLAQQYRCQGQKEEAIREFKKALESAGRANEITDKILAVRAIAEIHSENGDNSQCKQFLNRFEDLVKRDPTEYQLMLTVAAYCMIKLYTSYEIDERLLKEAQQYAKRSLEMLEAHEMDRRKMLDGDSYSIRKLNCHRMLAEIAGLLNNKEDGEKHSRIAFDLAVGRKDSQFEIMRARIDFPWREDKVKIAQDLCNLANSSVKSKKVEAHLFLAQVHFEREEITKGEEVLFQIHEAAAKPTVADEDKEKYSELLKFAFKAATRAEKLRQFTQDGDQSSQFHMSDKLGDLYLDAGYKKAALRYYRTTTRLAETDIQKRNALVSCAETSADLKMYREAAEYFDLVRQIEIKMGKDISETLASCFEMRILAGTFKSDANVNMEVDKLERDINNPRFLRAVYDSVTKYYENKGKNYEADRFRSLSKGLIVNNVEEEEEEDEEDFNCDEWDDITILSKMRKKAVEYGKKMQLANTAGKKNSYGESKLIELAREGTLDEVKFLVEKGESVNKQDPMGWTPLSEAVAADKIDIVMYLLSKKADPNTKSNVGWMDTNFAGGITPLMEACTNGFHKIAMRLLSHERANDLVVATNMDGWSPVDFMHRHIRDARRGEESEGEFQLHLTACKEVLEKMKRMQRLKGFPMRGCEPPEPRATNGDTARYAAEKERSQRAERIQKKRGAVEEFKGGLAGIGSRSKMADKENRKDKKKKKEEEDLMFNDSDDEPLIRRPTSSAKKSKVVMISSDSEEEEEEEEMKKEPARKKKSMYTDDLNFGLDDAIELPSFSHMRRSGSSQPKKTAVKEFMQKKGTKRSTEKEYDTGIAIVSDDEEMDTVVKRRRNESESSHNESPDHHRLLPPRPSINNSFRDQMDFDGGSGAASVVVSPAASIHRADSHSSLTSASALSSIFVKFIIVREGAEREESFLSKAPSYSTIVDLPKKVDKLREALDGGSADYVCMGNILDSTLTVSDMRELAEMNGKSIPEIECRMKKTMKSEFNKNCDSSDRDSALSDALHTLETSRAPSLVINNGSKYKEKTRAALWQVIEEFAREKLKVDAKWRVERVEVEQFDDIPASALRALIKLRPRENLSLRSCGIDDAKLEEMAEELNATDNWRLAKVDLSNNDLIRSSEILSKMISKFNGVHSIILHGLSGIDEGMELMKTLGGLSLIFLTLNENPWLDDSCMEELMRGDGIKGRLNTIQVSRTAIRTMKWMDEMRGIKSMNIAENNITASGWEKVAEYIRSNATALYTIDMRGTAARPIILEALAARSPTASMLRVTLTKCSLITPSEMCRALSPLVIDEGRRVNVEMTIEGEKIEEVRAVSVPIATRVLKMPISM